MADILFATGDEENGRPMNGRGLPYLSMQDIQSKHPAQVVAVYRYLHNISVFKINVAGFDFQGYIK